MVAPYKSLAIVKNSTYGRAENLAGNLAGRVRSDSMAGWQARRYQAYFAISCSNSFAGGAY